MIRKNVSDGQINEVGRYDSETVRRRAFGKILVGEITLKSVKLRVHSLLATINSNKGR